MKHRGGSHVLVPIARFTRTFLSSRHAVVITLVCMLILSPAPQTNAQSSQSDASGTQDSTPTFATGSSLVLVPALVKTKNGKVVFALTADDFTLTDNGDPQPLRLESDTDSQPLALAVIVQTGGQGASHLSDYAGLSAILDAIAGNVDHRIAVISFDSHPVVAKDFTPDTDAAAKTISNLNAGDPGVAILDALNFGVQLLRAQPPQYRRAILLLSETVDRTSQSTLEDTLRAIDDTNTSIYSFGFSSTKTALKHERSKIPRPGGSPYMDAPYAPGGCMSRSPDADPDAQGKRSVQTLDCASDLFPPLRLARLAFIAARDGMARNVPESVAKLTGGEYFAFKDAKTLRTGLINISNDVPNHYVLSFHPQSPQPGFHALDLKLKDISNLEVHARNAYWVDAPAASNK
jgi:VWFA-related protein